MTTTHAEMLSTLNVFLQKSVDELRSDGATCQTALLFRDDVPVVGVMIDFRGPEHKEAAWKSIMDLARTSGADAVGLILDVYCAPVGSGLAPSEDPAATEALVISTVKPGVWSYTMLRYGRGDDGAIQFADRMTSDEVDDSFDSTLPLAMAEALDEPTRSDADEAKRLMRQLIEMGASVGLMPQYA